MGITSLEADRAMLLEKETDNEDKKMRGNHEREQETVYVQVRQS